MAQRAELISELGEANYELFLLMVKGGCHTHNKRVITISERVRDLQRDIFELDEKQRAAAREVSDKH